jgi:putative membrane-bound dehydrogenase-like protein
MTAFRLLAGVIALQLIAGVVAAGAAEIEPPKAMEPGVKVSLFAAEPQVVTPIGATVDGRGRLLVVESNTHFRPKNYKGPLGDRILAFEDTTGSGKADRVTTFYEAGDTYLMNIATDRDGSILVSQRNEIFRLIPNEQGLAGKKISLAHLQSKADYPHNGLHGLAVGPDGTIYFGIGENYGMPWELLGTDGGKLSETTGAGAVFRMDSQGRGLTRIAKGFWNPFGLGVDPNNQLWLVDNDPDGRPPCRLIDVAPGAHYGFEFRYGRTGMHYLQAWDGELPGTLGMVAGVGEAPCAVVWSRGRLFVSSWRDHQVESYSLTPRGATYTATIHPIVKGGEDFRPTGLAFAPDGSLFVNDWANKSYPVHGAGRIWKIAFASKSNEPAAPPVDAARQRAAQLRDSSNISELTAALDDADAATAQAAQYGLSKLADAEKIQWSSLKTARERIGLLNALLIRGTNLAPLVSEALKDQDDLVRQMAIRCVTEQQITSAKPELERLLQSQALSPRLLGMTVAASNQLDGDPGAKVDSKKLNALLLARIDSPDATDSGKAAALHMMQANHPQIALNKLKPMAMSKSTALQIEAVRYLNTDMDPARFDMLAAIAADTKADASVRAEAVLGIAFDPGAHLDLLLKLAADEQPTVRAEALRALRPTGPTLAAAQRGQLKQIAAKHKDDADLVARVIDPLPTNRPAESDEAGWQKVLATAPGDPEAGRRIFFQPNGAGCYRCHMVEGRGRAIGPDLTMIGHSQTREHVLESILDPSREIAPLYTVWTITSSNSEPVTGMLLRRDGQSNEIYVDASGQEMKVKEETVTNRIMRSESLMPTGLVQGLTDQELRDVVAFLMQKR